MIAAYHPETGHTAILTDDQLSHMRMAGWMTQAEWNEQQAAKAAAETAATSAKGTSKAPDK